MIQIEFIDFDSVIIDDCKSSWNDWVIDARSKIALS